MGAPDKARAGQGLCEQAHVLSLMGLECPLSLSWGPSWNEVRNDPRGGEGVFPPQQEESGVAEAVLGSPSLFKMSLPVNCSSWDLSKCWRERPRQGVSIAAFSGDLGDSQGDGGQEGEGAWEQAGVGARAAGIYMVRTGCSGPRGVPSDSKAVW